MASALVPVLSLEEVLHEHLHSALVENEDAIAAVAGKRNREQWLRRFLPPQIIRRLDRGFARSYTVHPDTARALYAVARAVRPAVIFETGTYWGYSTAILAAAVRDAGSGVVHSFDLYPHAGAHIPSSLMEWVRLHRGAPATASMPAVLQDALPDLLFQDSVHDYDGVLAELRVVAPRMKPGAVVCFHDFVVEGVVQAAVDGLPGWFIAQIAGSDPQQFGIAIAPGLRVPA
ncbi:MAG: class I SAM-dependent methyltransferase [bacterium]